MSAQDDVLSAFGAPVRKTPVEVSAPANEQRAETEPIGQAPELADGGPVGGEEAVGGQTQDSAGGGVIGGGPAMAGASAAGGPEATGATVADGPEMAGAAAAGNAAAMTGQGSAPGTGAQPYLDPAAFFAQLQAESAPQPKRRRPRPRLLLRYASVLAVAGALGVGTAYAITLPRRTDVPFLATPSDGRYTFPAMVRPAPPSGEPAPSDSLTHYSDLRRYLVAAPVGAVPKEDGWESVADFESSLSGADVSDHLYDAGLRRVAYRGWTTPDGQHTLVELLQFPDHQAAFGVRDMLDTAAVAKAGREQSVVPLLTVPSFGDDTLSVALRTFDAVTGLPGQKERRVVFLAGDVVAIVTTTAPAGVPDVPTEQVVLLEAQMLR